MAAVSEKSNAGLTMATAAAAPHAAQTDIHSIQPCGSCAARAHGLCGGVSLSDLPRLASVATIAEVARGQTFIHEAAPADDLLILILGSARLYKLLPDGRRQIIGFAYARSLLGLSAHCRTVSWLTTMPRAASIWQGRSLRPCCRFRTHVTNSRP